MIVLDSSFLVAYHNSRDVHHAAAKGAFPALIAGDWGPILLPEYVFLEVTTVLAARRDLAAAINVGDGLLKAKEVEFVSCSEFFLDAYEIFKRQTGPALSFADAAIVTIARRKGAEYVATFDFDFKKLLG